MRDFLWARLLPGASLEEIHILAEVCAKYKRIMAVHTRLFTKYDLYSLYEILYIAKSTGVKILLSHFVYQYEKEIMEEALAIVEKAKENGLDIMIDSGMYTDWATGIGTATFDRQSLGDNSISFSSLVVATGKYIGTTLNNEIYTELRNNHPEEAIICLVGHPEEVYRVLKKPYCIPSTDIGAYKKGEGHPQIAGTYPKYIKEMVRERKDLSLEEAITKATRLPAKLFGFKGKGEISVGADVDITIFNIDTIEDLACYPNVGLPDAKPYGIEFVIVNGQIVVDFSVYTGIKPGKIIRSDT